MKFTTCLFFNSCNVVSKIHTITVLTKDLVSCRSLVITTITPLKYKIPAFAKLKLNKAIFIQ